MINKYLIGGIVALAVVGGVWYHGYSYGYDKAVIENREAQVEQLEVDASNADALNDATNKREAEVKERIKYVYRVQDSTGCLKSDAPDGVYNLVR